MIDILIAPEEIYDITKKEIGELEGFANLEESSFEKFGDETFKTNQKRYGSGIKSIIGEGCEYDDISSLTIPLNSNPHGEIRYLDNEINLSFIYVSHYNGTLTTPRLQFIRPYMVVQYRHSDVSGAPEDNMPYAVMAFDLENGSVAKVILDDVEASKLGSLKLFEGKSLLEKNALHNVFNKFFSVIYQSRGYEKK